MKLRLLFLCAAVIFQQSCDSGENKQIRRQLDSSGNEKKFSYSGKIELHFSAMRNSYGIIENDKSYYSMKYQYLSESQQKTISSALNDLSDKMPPHKICADVDGEFELGDEGVGNIGKLTNIADVHPC